MPTRVEFSTAVQHLTKALFLSKPGTPPLVVLEIVDATMAKACVEQNIGITVLPTRVFDPKRDMNLRAIKAGHLFAPLVIHTVIHKNSYLRSYTQEFIRMFASNWDRRAIELAQQSKPKPNEWTASFKARKNN